VRPNLISKRKEEVFWVGKYSENAIEKRNTQGIIRDRQFSHAVAPKAAGNVLNDGLCGSKGSTSGERMCPN